MRTEAGNTQIYSQKSKKQARDEGLEPHCSLRREKLEPFSSSMTTPSRHLVNKLRVQVMTHVTLNPPWTPDSKAGVNSLRSVLHLFHIHKSEVASLRVSLWAADVKNTQHKNTQFTHRGEENLQTTYYSLT